MEVAALVGADGPLCFGVCLAKAAGIPKGNSRPRQRKDGPYLDQRPCVAKLFYFECAPHPGALPPLKRKRSVMGS